MEKSMFFNSVNGDRKYKAEDFARYFNAFVGNGIYPTPSSNLQVIGSDSDMLITINKGTAMINGYFYELTDNTKLKIDTSDSATSRVDRIVLRLSYEDREIKLKVLKGEWGSNVGLNIRRDSQYYDLLLAEITVKNGTIVVSQDLIKDTRQNSDVCGMIKGTIEMLDTSTAYLQYQAQFEKWFASLRKSFNNSQFNTIAGKPVQDGKYLKNGDVLQYSETRNKWVFRKGNVAIDDSGLFISNFTIMPTENKLTLSWDNPTSSEFGTMKVYMSEENVATFDKATLKATLTNKETTIAFDGLTNGKIYYFFLEAIDNDGDVMNEAKGNASPATNTYTFKTKISASAGNTVITLNWTPITDTNFNQFILMRKQGTEAPTGLSDSTATIIYTGANTGFKDTGLINGKPYSYRIFPFKKNGEFNDEVNGQTITSQPIASRVHGVRVNTDGTCVRLEEAVGKTANAGLNVVNDFNTILPWGGIRNCRLGLNGEVMAYLGDAKYNVAPNDGYYQYMTEIPKFWYKQVQGADGSLEYYISDGARAGFEVHPMFFRRRQGTDINLVGRKITHGYINEGVGKTWDENRVIANGYHMLDKSDLVIAKPNQPYLLSFVRDANYWVDEFDSNYVMTKRVYIRKPPTDSNHVAEFGFITSSNAKYLSFCGYDNNGGTFDFVVAGLFLTECPPLVEVDKRYISTYLCTQYDPTNKQLYGGSGNTVSTSAIPFSTNANGILPSIGAENSFEGIIATQQKNLPLGWSECDWFMIHGLQLLYLVEYANVDSSAVIGIGGSANSGYKACGSSDNLGNLSGYNTSNYVCRYRGIESLWGSAFYRIQGAGMEVPQGTEASLRIYLNNDNLYPNLIQRGMFNKVVYGATEGDMQMGLDGYGMRFMKNPYLFFYAKTWSTTSFTTAKIKDWQTTSTYAERPFTMSQDVVYNHENNNGNGIFAMQTYNPSYRNHLATRITY